MNLDSLIIAMVVAALVWLLMRHGQSLRARRTASRAAAPSMPRVGAAGTVTREQLERLKALHFEVSPDWSREEADLILDAVDYLRAVIKLHSGQADPPLELQNRLLVLILGDAALRARLKAWGDERRARGTDPPVQRDELFERTAAAI